MPEKFTYEKHRERMRQILAQTEPVDRTDIVRSLLDRVRGGQLPRLPRKPKLPRIGEPRL